MRHSSDPLGPQHRQILALQAPGPIETAYFEYERLAQIADDAALALWDAEERYEEPERPMWKPWTCEGGYDLVPLPGGKCRVYSTDSSENIARLRSLAFDPYNGNEFGAEYHAGRAERARAELGRIEAWQAERSRRKDAAGVTELETVGHAAYAAAREVANAIFAMVPNTFREVAHQAAVLCGDWDAFGADRVVSNLVGLAGIKAYGKTSTDEEA